MSYVMVFGAGVTGQAVTSVLSAEGLEVMMIDDAVLSPEMEELESFIEGASQVVVSPGVPLSHPVHKLAAGKLISEIGLARPRIKIPFVAVTGTNGKTTVVTLVTRMLMESGMRVQAAGNIGTPLISVDTSSLDVVVAELSSFQLATTPGLAPDVGAWLNFQPDHLDWHRDINDYRLSKARIWQGIGDKSVIVANAHDQVVMSEARKAQHSGARMVTWGGGNGMWRRVGDMLVSPEGDELIAVDSLYRSMPHDVDNALAAMAIATSTGASIEGCMKGLLQFHGLPHRVESIADCNGVEYIDDSKSTTPSSTAVAIAGIGDTYGQGKIVLIAGGRNKGLDIGMLRDYARFLKAMVSIGEAASEIKSAMSGICPVTIAESMQDAVNVATDLVGDYGVVLLSPACSSYDWYQSYAERGDDFRACVMETIRNGGHL